MVLEKGRKWFWCGFSVCFAFSSHFNLPAQLYENETVVFFASCSFTSSLIHAGVMTMKLSYIVKVCPMSRTGIKIAMSYTSGVGYWLKDEVW